MKEEGSKPCEVCIAAGMSTLTFWHVFEGVHTQDNGKNKTLDL